jgi:hypothetical protein
MAPTESSKSNNPNLLYDRFRKRWVAKTPEEIVRQTLLQLMTEKLGYPVSHIAVEKALDQMPHLKHYPSKLPSRRADVVCFAKGIHSRYSLFPLLLIECKEDRIDQAAIEQVVGYNAFVQAPFSALADASGVSLLLPDGKLQKGLPTYEQLRNAVSR